MGVVNILVGAVKVTFLAIAMLVIIGLVVFGVPLAILLGSITRLGGLGGFTAGCIGVIFYYALLWLILDTPLDDLGPAIVALEEG